MDLFESHTVSFVVRIWRERLRDGDEGFTWRGHITSVPSGERSYFDNLDDIATFVAPHLASIGVPLAPRRRAGRSLCRWLLWLAHRL